VKLLLVNVVAALCILIALEGASRLIKPVDFPDPLITQRPDWSRTRLYDPLLFWRMRPHLFRNGEQITNSLGLRGEEIPPRARMNSAFCRWESRRHLPGT
jgi:hypothetical protein